ncbi:Hypothetical predicted protein [Mytilus galloprovincialis]|uniref:Uncharacterized protein n=1 Tax=Mytilus galloprovincialis TaxID=29158 RepID=A0A8B6BPG1_MYTGA|nr:Hypothetical predicted protein [Mytilus galloprovincialis]
MRIFIVRRRSFPVVKRGSIQSRCLQNSNGKADGQFSETGRQLFNLFIVGKTTTTSLQPNRKNIVRNKTATADLTNTETKSVNPSPYCECGEKKHQNTSCYTAQIPTEREDMRRQMELLNIDPTNIQSILAPPKRETYEATSQIVGEYITKSGRFQELAIPDSRSCA